MNPKRKRGSDAHALIEATDLGFTYPGADSPTLSGLTFSLGSGDIFGFLGPSGSGKSTTQKILYRLLTQYTGSVQLFGRELGQCGPEIYDLMGIAFETPNLYLKLTGRENLEFALALRQSSHSGGKLAMEASGVSSQTKAEATAQATAKAESKKAIDIDAAALRLGLEDAIDKRVETWSKGMRMRLSFIRAVLHRPVLLFLDEPTSGLDPLWSRKVKDWILELRTEGTAVFLTTHSMELADELCGTVGFLVDGRLATQDSPMALKQRHGRQGITVYGVDGEGQPKQAEVEYAELLSGPVEGFSQISRVTNREVSLEQVFLSLTGRSLQEDSRGSRP